MLRMVGVVAAFSFIAFGSPVAQICNSMTGSLNCSSPEGFLPGVGEGNDIKPYRAGNLPPVSTLGADIMGTGEAPGTFGSISFGRGERRCSGMFRSVNC